MALPAVTSDAAATRSLTMPVIGGTGVYAGATGLNYGGHLASGVRLEVLRLQLP
jgi:hypothetical protein